MLYTFKWPGEGCLKGNFGDSRSLLRDVAPNLNCQIRFNNRQSLIT